MIVKMKKFHFIVQKKNMSESLNSLREIGVAHIDIQEAVPTDNVGKVREDIAVLEQAITTLEEKRKDVKEDFVQKNVDDWRGKSEDILELVSHIDNLREKIFKHQVFIKTWHCWGDFDPHAVRDLEKRGVYFKLFEVPVKDLAQIPADIVFKKLGVSGGVARCVLISKEKKELPFRTVELPYESLGDVMDLEKREKIRIEELSLELQENTCYLKMLKKKLLEKKNELCLEEVASDMVQDEELSWLSGFCPEDVCKDLEVAAKEKHWGILIEDPSEDDQVPTLLRNPKWVETIKPVLNMTNILPGYKELDMSLPFLLFFSMFVGMLIGDAGYGLVIGLVFAIVHFINRKKIKNPVVFTLIYVLCGCIIIWGILTGTFFGQKWLAGNIKPLAPWLLDTTNLQMLCFLIGAIHLSIAHVWKAIVRFPSLSFLNQIGWLSVVWGMFFAAKMLVLGSEFPPSATILFYVGAFLIILFSAPNKNPLKAIGPGLGDFLLNIINTFTDVVSYIRLFAVGLATVAVSDAANEMSLFWIIFLHSLNVALAAMAILVHGLRLNVLEFSSHLGLEWSGIKYNPFKKIEIE